MFNRFLSWLDTRALPHSLLGRLSLVMVAGMLVSQIVATLIWSAQQKHKAENEIRISSQYLAHSASSTIQYFYSLPESYRSILINQIREVGGTRFFVQTNNAPVPIKAIDQEPVADAALKVLRDVLRSDLPSIKEINVAFAWPDDLQVTSAGAKLNELPENWVQHTLLVKPDPAPILVIQVKLDEEHWLYLGSLMPNPYFLKNSEWLTLDRVLLQAFSLLSVLILLILVVRWITRPLAALSDAAEAFGKGEHTPELPDTGSREFTNTARAFSLMRQRIQRYIEDRERLFVSISHDLRTPITRLKLRAELLDDELMRQEFEEDLDELDVMVKGALQCVKDSDIHENPTIIKLDTLLRRLVKSARLANFEVNYQASGIQVFAKPLALKRAIGNLLDNALFYGHKADIEVRTREPGEISIQIRDFGPGVPQEALAKLFDPYVRLGHGREQNESGMGLGLGIARGIIESHGGQLILENHPEGGLVATIILPA